MKSPRTWAVDPKAQTAASIAGAAITLSEALGLCDQARRACLTQNWPAHAGWAPTRLCVYLQVTQQGTRRTICHHLLSTDHLLGTRHPALMTARCQEACPSVSLASTRTRLRLLQPRTASGLWSPTVQNSQASPGKKSSGSWLWLEYCGKLPEKVPPGVQTAPGRAQQDPRDHPVP